MTSLCRRGLPGLTAATALAAAGVLSARPAAQVPPPPLTISHDARAVAPGEAVLLTFQAARGLASVRGTAFGHPFSAYPGADPDTWHALVGIDLSTSPGGSEVSVEARHADGAPVRAGARLTVEAKTFATRRLTVAPEFVTPPASVQARIERERQLLDRLLSDVSPQRLWTDGFGRPVGGEVISVFGVRSVFNGEARAPHRGIDFRGASGTPVRAPARGRVVLAEDLYFSGSSIVLDHGVGAFSLLAHLSRIDVRPGTLVSRGDVVGAIGATGRVTGPHLHWTLRIGPAAVDPLSVLALAGARR